MKAFRKTPMGNAGWRTANLFRLFVGQLCSWVFGVKRRAAFHRHVFSVVGLSSEKQMVGSDTGWIVTVMQNLQPFFDWAIGEFIRNPMRSVFLRAYPEHAVAESPVKSGVKLTFALPQPAGFRLFDFGPKAGLHVVGAAKGFIEAHPATKCFSTWGCKGLAAVSAVSYSVVSHDVHSPYQSVNRLVRLVRGVQDLVRAVPILAQNTHLPAENVRRGVLI
jgi:hypothetical protein